MRFLFFFLALLTVYLPAFNLPAAAAEEVRYPQLTLTPVALDESALPAGMTLLAAMRLEASSRLVGGISGVALGPEGRRLHLLSDRARWLTAIIARDKEGKLTGLTKATLTNLTGPEERALSRPERDAESIILTPDGTQGWVSFERRPRLWRYNFTPPPLQFLSAAELPDLEGRLAYNGGFESLARLRDGRWILLSEGSTADRQDQALLLIGAKQSWQQCYYPLEERYNPTDIALLPDGRLLVLERRTNLTRTAFKSRLRLLDLPANCKKKQTVRPSSVLLDISALGLAENMEGLAVHPRPDGSLELWLVNDNNFTRSHPNLILQFLWTPGASAS